MALQPSWRMLAISAAVSVMLTACGGGSDNNTPQNRPLPVVPIDAGYSGDNGDSSIIPHSSPVLSVNNTPNGTLRPSARNTVTLQLLDPSGAPIPGNRRVRVDLPEGVTFPGVGQSGIVTFVDGVATFDVTTGSTCTRDVPLALTDLATGTPLQATLQANCDAGGGSGSGGGNNANGGGSGGSSITVPCTSIDSCGGGNGGGNNATPGGNGGGNTPAVVPDDGSPTHLEVVINPGTPNEGKLTPGKPNTITVKLCRGAAGSGCTQLVDQPGRQVTVGPLPDDILGPNDSKTPIVTLTRGEGSVTITPPISSAGKELTDPITAKPVNDNNPATTEPKEDSTPASVTPTHLEVVVDPPAADGSIKVTVNMCYGENKDGCAGGLVPADTPVEVTLPDNLKPKDGVNLKEFPLKRGTGSFTIAPPDTGGAPTGNITAEPVDPAQNPAKPDETPVTGGGAGEPTHLEVIVNPGDPAKTGKLIPGEPNTIQVRLCKGATATTTPCPDADLVDQPGRKVTVGPLPDGITGPNGNKNPEVTLTGGKGEITITPDATVSTPPTITATPVDDGNPNTSEPAKGDATPTVGGGTTGEPTHLEVFVNGTPDGTLQPGVKNTIEVKLCKGATVNGCADGVVPENREVKVGLPNGVKLPEGSTVNLDKVPLTDGVATIDIFPDPSTAGTTPGPITATPVDDDDPNTTEPKPGEATPDVGKDAIAITSVNGTDCDTNTCGTAAIGSDTPVTISLTDPDDNNKPLNGDVVVELPDGVTCSSDCTQNPDGTFTVTVTDGTATFKIKPETGFTGDKVTVSVTSPGKDGASVDIPVTNDKATITNVNGNPVSDDNTLLPGVGNKVDFQLTDKNGAPLQPSGKKAEVTLTNGKFPDGSTTMMVDVATDGTGTFPIIPDGADPVTVKVKNPDTGTTTTADAIPATADVKDPIPVGDDDGSLKLVCGTDGKATIADGKRLKTDDTWQVAGAHTGWAWKTSSEAAEPMLHVATSHPEAHHAWVTWMNKHPDVQGRWITPGTTANSYSTTTANFFRVKVVVDARVKKNTVDIIPDTLRVDDWFNGVEVTPNDAAPTNTALCITDGCGIHDEEPFETNVPLTDALFSGTWTPGATNYLVWKVSNKQSYHEPSTHGGITPPHGDDGGPTDLVIDKFTIQAECE